VYTRTVKDKELTFGTSGKLYKDALVMYDRQTGSLWTQVDGSVLRGEMKGARLEPVPAVQTTWAEWKKLHPDTLVLKKDRPITGSPYADYFASGTRMGVAGSQNPDKRLPGKELVVTLRQGGEALAIPLAALEQAGLHQTEIGGVPVAVIWNPGARTVRVFDRRVEGRTLTFAPAGRAHHLRMNDGETGGVWDGMSGQALRGPLAGAELRPVPHMVNYWFAWVAYNPRTRLEKP